ncbi:hypothetical protein VCBJG01_1982, partial [Vibrio cholerae BJG-01]
MTEPSASLAFAAPP